MPAPRYHQDLDLMARRAMSCSVLEGSPTHARCSPTEGRRPRPHPAACRRHARPRFAQRAGQGLTARWLGQDGQDLISPSPAPAPAPNQVQDIHLQVTGLPAGRQVARARLTGLGGGEWVFNEPGGHWRLEVVQKPGDTVADLYFEVGGPEKGRPWTLTLTLDDGRSAQVQIQGRRGRPQPATRQRRREGKLGRPARRATSAAQGPAVGPDGKVDALITLSQLSPRMEVKADHDRRPGQVPAGPTARTPKATTTPS